MKPILFNTEMVRAILDGRKTVTRRTVSQGKSNPLYHNREKFYGVVDHLNDDYKNWYAGFYNDNDIFCGATGGRHIDAIYFKAPYKVNDILYVRETWGTYNRNWWEADYFLYRADYPDGATTYEHNAGVMCDLPNWRPSIHMPKEAARIFLKVTGVRVERLQDITNEQILLEGVDKKRIERVLSQMPEPADEWERACYALEWAELWDTTIKKDQLQYYGWNANPYVWVIEFEVIDKAAALKEGQA